MRLQQTATACEFRIMTAYAGESERELAQAAGLEAPLSKPLRVSQLKSLAEDVREAALLDVAEYEQLLASNFEGDLELLRRVFDALGRSISKDLKELEQALEQADLERASQLCHKLGGGLSEFGATKPLDCLASLRLHVKAPTYDGKSALRVFSTLRLAIETARQQLSHWLATRIVDLTRNSGHPGG